MAVDVPAAEVESAGFVPGRRLASATFEATAFQFAALPFSFATTIITSRYLLPEGRGSFVLTLLTVTLVWTLLSNVMVGVTNEIGYHSRPASTILPQAIALALLLGVVGGAILLPVNLGMQSTNRIVVLATLALPAMLVTANVSGALMPLGRFRDVNILQFLPQLFVVLGMLVLVVALGRHLTGAVVGWTGAQLLVAVIALVRSRDIWLETVRRRSWLHPNRMKPMLRLGLAFGVVNLMGTLNYRIELFVLQAYRGLGSVGVYSVAASLAEFAWLPVAALAMVSTPAIVNTDAEASVSAVAKGVRHTVVLSIGFALVVGGAGVLLIPTFFGERFAGARTPLALLLPAIVVFAPTKIAAVYLSSRLGRPAYQFAMAVASTLVTAAAAIALVPSLGMSGAAIATCLGYAVGLILEVAFLSRFGVPIASLVPRRADLDAYRAVVRAATTRVRSRGMHAGA